MSSDDEGRYEVHSLPAGRYTLSVSKGGCVTVEYGQTRPLERGKMLEVVDGKTLDKVDFSLPHGGVITGRVTDEYGEAISDAMVQAMRYQYLEGQRRLMNAGRVVASDDIGQFRIFGLPPGSYYVRATIRNGSSTEDPDSTSWRAPTYFTGTARLTEAQSVSLTIAQEFAGVNFPLIRARMSHITGAAVNSQGRPLVAGLVTLWTRLPNPILMRSGGGGRTGPNGNFTISNVAPGEYVLEVRSGPDAPSIAGAEGEYASTPLSLNGEDISGITVVTNHGATIEGRVVFQGESAPPMSRLQMQVFAVSPDADQVAPIGPHGYGRVAANGSFELRALFGPQLIRVANVPLGWALQAVTLDSADITDSGYQFQGGGSGAVEIVLTDRAAKLLGAVRDKGNQPAQDCTVVVFPDDVTRRGFQSRFVKTARSDRDGHFAIDGLPSGRYFAVALQTLEQGAESDPEFLKQLERSAKSFSLTENQTLPLDLGPIVWP